jgi:hypothetical protein
MQQELSKRHWASFAVTLRFAAPLADAADILHG